VYLDLRVINILPVFSKAPVSPASPPFPPSLLLESPLWPLGFEGKLADARRRRYRPAPRLVSTYDLPPARIGKIPEWMKIGMALDARVDRRPALQKSAPLISRQNGVSRARPGARSRLHSLGGSLGAHRDP